MGEIQMSTAFFFIIVILVGDAVEHTYLDSKMNIGAWIYRGIIGFIFAGISYTISKCMPKEEPLNATWAWTLVTLVCVISPISTSDILINIIDKLWS
jgi:hypothetical protein